MTIVGTRPEIIKLSCTMNALDQNFKHIIVHTGQNFDYELNEVFFSDLELRKPDYFLNAAGLTPAETIGNVISKIDPILENEKPDAVLFYGDTNSCLAIIAAKRRKIPIFHMEAGNRCFDQRVPEELNRKIVDNLSDINMVHSEHARRYLIQEGLRPETIFKTGSPMNEIFKKHQARIDSSKVLEKLDLQPGQFFVVSAHREENIDSDQNFKDLLATLEQIAQIYNYPIIVSTHPRTRKKLETINHRASSKLVRFMKPLGFLDYNKLQINAKCVISDSGTITEESSLLGFPAIMIRQAHERPEGMDVGVVIMSGLKANRVIDSIEIVTKQHEQQRLSTRAISDYDNDFVSDQVIRIIQSYTDYINRTVWKK